MVNRVATTTGPERWVRAVADDGPARRRRRRASRSRAGRCCCTARDGEVHAIDDVCSHAGALLSRGEIDDCIVTCPLHVSRFDLRDGHIVRGPAHHPQPVLPTRMRNGWIEVRGSLRSPGRGARRTEEEPPWRGKR